MTTQNRKKLTDWKVMLSATVFVLLFSSASALNLDVLPTEANAMKDNSKGNPNDWPFEGPAPPKNPDDVVPDSTPELNTIDKEFPEKAKVAPPRGKFGVPIAGQADFASIAYQKSTINAVYGILQPHTTVSLSSGQVLYAPALQPPNYSPLEVVTAYVRATGSSTTENAYKVWNHPSSSFVVSKPFDATFFNNYVVVEGGKNFFYNIIEKNGSQWRVLLYNKVSNSWEVQYTSTGSSSINDGWMSWESTFNGACPSIPSVQGKNFLVKDNGSWQSVTSSYGKAYNTMTCSYPTSWVSQFYNWIVN